MKTLLLVVALLLALPAVARGQTVVHPCDTPPQTTPTKGNRVGWCHDRKDVDNLLYAPGTLGFKIYLPGTVIDTGTALQPIGAASSRGEFYYEFPVSTSGTGRGEYTVTVTAYSAEGESLPSTAITWQIGGPPSVPKNPRIK